MILEEATLIIVGSQVAKASKKRKKWSAHKTVHLRSLILEGSIYVHNIGIVNYDFPSSYLERL